MKYCLVQNNTIISGPTNLPENTESISNFNLLSNDELLMYGWYPFTLIDNPLINQVFVDYTIEIMNNEVVKTMNYRDMTQTEIDDKNKKVFDEKWNRIRNKRNRFLSASDWSQLPDSPVDKQSWALYRTQLRNIPQNFTNPDDVVFPNPPQS